SPTSNRRAASAAFKRESAGITALDVSPPTVHEVASGVTRAVPMGGVGDRDASRSYSADEFPQGQSMQLAQVPGKEPVLKSSVTILSLNLFSFMPPSQDL
ncbi:hypothetical protein ACFV2N_47430, partial [Streptomyces sp. NPDC059680]|uniref:hypothetical protein n=1 Tax=Streptomyces sp. NPDC059680 TaxID=3346904 RepID=UPI00367DA7B7